MATLRDAIEYAKKNPNDPRNVELYKHLKIGTFDAKAMEEGIDISSVSQTFKTADNIGTGFDPTQEFLGDENFSQAVGKTIVNTPKSALELGKNIVSAIANPIQTGKTLFKAVKGLGERGGREILERTSFSDKVAQVPETESEETFNQLLSVINDRYGSIDKFKETVVEDPVGALADIAGFTGASAKVAKVTSLNKTTGVLQKTAQVIDPVSTITAPVRATGGMIKRILPDVLPNIEKISNQNIVKALDLTQGDVRDFRNRSGQNVGDYLTSKKVNGKSLLDDDVEVTLSNVDEMITDSYRKVREEISAIDRIYTADDLPNVKQVLSQTSEQLKDVVGLQDELGEVNTLLSKDSYTLSDIQRVKEIIDERYNIYKKSGDVSSSNAAQGLDNVRRDIRSFIEKEVNDATGGNVNIASLNDDVRFGHAMTDAIERGLTRDLTRNEFGLTDHIVGTGLGIGVLGGGISIGTAVGLFLTKKVLESPAFRISLAQGVKKVGDSKSAELLKQLRNNKLSPENTEILRDVVQTARDNAVIINPALADIERINSEPESE